MKTLPAWTWGPKIETMKCLGFHFSVWLKGPDGFVHGLQEKRSSVMIAVWENALRGVPANLLVQNLTKQLFSETRECQTSLASNVGGLSFLALLPVVRIQPTLLLFVLCHQSPGDDKKSAQKCKTTLLLKELSERERTMRWLESSEKVARNDKIWSKSILWDVAA